MARAVVFDCDGVLVDSEPHSAAAWVAALGRYGHRATAADVAACTGLGYAATYAHLAAVDPEVALPSPEDLTPEVLAALAASFDRGLLVFPDAADVRHRPGLRRGRPWGWPPAAGATAST